MIDYKAYAIEYHGEQKYGEHPYSYHLEKVAQILTDFGYTEDKWQASAWLHDVLEDTKARPVDIMDLFGLDVFKLVWAVTGEGLNRKEKQASIIRKLHEYKEACVLKLADRIANLEACIVEHNVAGKMAMYHKELPVFEKVVRKHTPPEMWDRLCDAFEYGKTKGWV